MSTRSLLAALLALLPLAPLARAGEPPLNGCTVDTAQRWSELAAPARQIDFQCCEYLPPCVLISAGQSVTFAGTFNSHPLAPGRVEGSTTTPQPGNPIPATGSGSTPLEVPFPDPGDWGYFCDFHFEAGMYGAVFVALFADGFEDGSLAGWSTATATTP